MYPPVPHYLGVGLGTSLPNISKPILQPTQQSLTTISSFSKIDRGRERRREVCSILHRLYGNKEERQQKWRVAKHLLFLETSIFI